MNYETSLPKQSEMPLPKQSVMLLPKQSETSLLKQNRCVCTNCRMLSGMLWMIQSGTPS